LPSQAILSPLIVARKAKFSHYPTSFIVSFDHFMPNKGVGAKHSISVAIVPSKKPVLD
jgi:hypothetical protein